jgi:hypothetical protein
LDLPQILNLSLGDQTKIKINDSNEDDLQWKTTSKYWEWNISVTTHTQISNLRFDDQTIFHKSLEDIKKKGLSQQPLFGSYSNFILTL